MIRTCPICHSKKLNTIYQVKQIPVQSVVLLHTHTESVSFSTGDMDLVYCKNCEFIFNQSFQPELVDYGLENESTQRFSGTFNKFELQIANDLIQRFDLHNKTIIEIGCGQGEFLALLCKNDNKGIGFDPAYDKNRNKPINDNYYVIDDYYSEKYSDLQADFICCKMTLEHISAVGDMIETLRSSIQDKQTKVFFQIPDVTRILQEKGFWDIYYEHCSYFNSNSLSTLFESRGFEVIDVWRDYGDQYLMISASPSNSKTSPSIERNESPGFSALVESFKAQIPITHQSWRAFFEKNKAKRIVFWGAGSKCVAFCTTLKIQEEITHAIDINPKKENTYLPGTGQKVVTPEVLPELNPDIVLILNPIYTEEITKTLHAYGFHPQIVRITDI